MTYPNNQVETHYFIKFILRAIFLPFVSTVPFDLLSIISFNLSFSLSCLILSYMYNINMNMFLFIYLGGAEPVTGCLRSFVSRDIKPRVVLIQPLSFNQTFFLSIYFTITFIYSFVRSLYFSFILSLLFLLILCFHDLIKYLTESGRVPT